VRILKAALLFLVLISSFAYANGGASGAAVNNPGGSVNPDSPYSGSNSPQISPATPPTNNSEGQGSSAAPSNDVNTPPKKLNPSPGSANKSNGNTSGNLYRASPNPAVSFSNSEIAK